LAKNDFELSAPGDLLPVCSAFFFYFYNVSRNKLYYARQTNSGLLTRNGKKVQLRQYPARKYSSVYAWLSEFAKNFQLSPDSDSINLPFADKRQVFMLYTMALKAQDGGLFFSVAPCIFHSLFLTLL